MDVEKVRELLPYLKTGKIYFNHASSGVYSNRVVKAINDYTEMRSVGEIDNVKLVVETFKKVKNELGNLINTTADRIAFLDNTSNGLNILAQGLNLKKGDRILINDLEFPSNVYPFLNLKKNGIEVEFMKSHNGIVTAEDIINGIKPETKLVSISYVQFLTGYRVDLGKIGKYCKENNIIFCVDAIQGLAALRLDVQKYHIDFLSCGTWKWFMGMQGFAFIYVAKELQEKLEQKFVGWTSVEDAWNLLDYNLTLRKSADRYQNGTPISIGAFILEASLSLLKDFGYDNVEKSVLDNSEYLIKQLVSIGINPILQNVNRNNLSGIVSFKIDNAGNIFEQLENNNIKCAVREGMIRLSPHFYNIKEEIDEVVKTLNKLS